MEHIATKEASVVADAISEILDDWTPFIHTTTSDNGKELTEHQRIAKSLNIDYYFARPYHSWE